MGYYNVARTIPEWEEHFLGMLESLHSMRTPEVIKLPKAMHLGSIYEKPTVERRLFTTENFSLVVEFYVAKPILKTEPPKPQFTKEQLLKMLAELEK